MTSIINSLLALIGITSVPSTPQEFLWDTIVLVVSLYVIKYCMIFIISLFNDMLKIH